jgi:leader peptidase (prepilin peptidase) / N-methyltransferase
MEVLTLILILAVGLIFGSFLNVCISRLPRHKSIVHPRSRCPHCGILIAAYDNIPVLSFLLLRGHCRFCRKAISWRYPAVEIALAALWLLCWLSFGLSLQAIGMAVLSFLLLGLAAMDAETLRLPNTFTLPGVVLGAIYSGARCQHWLKCALLSASWAITAAGILLAFSGIYWLLTRKEGMGVGDAKLMALVAAWLGPGLAALVLFFGVVSAAFYGISISVARRRFDGNFPLPFGSFLCAAALYASFDGYRTVHWYLGFFH